MSHETFDECSTPLLSPSDVLKVKFRKEIFVFSKSLSEKYGVAEYLRCAKAKVSSSLHRLVGLAYANPAMS